MFGTFIYLLLHLILNKNIVKIVPLNVALPSSPTLCSALLSSTTLFHHTGLLPALQMFQSHFSLRACALAVSSAWLALFLFQVCTHSCANCSERPKLQLPTAIGNILFCVFLFVSTTFMAVLIDIRVCVRVYTYILCILWQSQVLCAWHLEQYLAYSKHSRTIC